MRVSRGAILGVVLVSASCGGVPPPPFERSGVIEGFYGPPWSHQDRLDVIRFMGRVGLGTYFYAPKNDPYHRQRWREPYPESEREQLQELVDSARAHGVEFYFAISPGLSITYADSSDYRILLRKLNSVAELGVSRFALFLDDVPPLLEHERDREVFETLAEAHVDLINRLHRDLTQRGASLVVTPTTYTSAWGDREYVRRLGERVAAGVLMFWTGIDVVAPEITGAQAAEWSELIARKPLIWDNYPVNDFARWRLFLGPVRRRGTDLSTAAAGIIANPMNEAHASMIPLATLADYARDPARYDPQRALEGALDALHGSDIARDLRAFVELYGDPWWEPNLFGPLFILDNEIDMAAIEAGLTRLDSALSRLERRTAAGGSELRALVAELEPFVTQIRARLRELQADATYERKGNLLVYRTDLDRLTAPQISAPIVLDGDLADWAGATWRDLVSSTSGMTGRALVALARDDERLHIALRVRDNNIRTRAKEGVGEGDHVALVIQSDLSERRRHLTPSDLVVLLPAPEGQGQPTPLIRSMQFEGFMAKFLADNADLTFSEFLVSTFGTSPAAEVASLATGLAYESRRTADGYEMEIGLPVEGCAELRLSLTAVDVGRRRTIVSSLSRRNYPANPATFSEILLQQ